jgi:hypothetical protein
MVNYTAETRAAAIFFALAASVAAGWAQHALSPQDGPSSGLSAVATLAAGRPADRICTAGRHAGPVHPLLAPKTGMSGK